MPVTFAPPDPFSSSISAGYGATEQFDKTLPTLAGLYSQNQNRQQQVSQFAQQQASQAQAQTARNRESAYQTDVQSSDQFELQRRLFAQQQQVQAQSQAFQWATQDRQLTHADQLHYEQQNAGVSEVMKMVQSGQLTEDEAGPLILKLKSGIDLYQQRLQKSHAQDFQAQADLRSQQTANLAKDNAHMEKFEADRIEAGYGTLSFHDQNGRMHVLLKNPKTQEWYNPLLEHNKMGSDQEIKQQELEQKRYDNLQQRYDSAFAKREAEVRKIHEQRRKLGTGKSGYEADEPDGDQIDIEVRNDLIRRGIHPPSSPASRSAQGTGPSDQATGQTAPPNTSGQDAQVDADQRGTQDQPSKNPATTDSGRSYVEKIRSSKASPATKQAVEQSIPALEMLLAKPATQRTHDDLRQIAQLKSLIELSLR